jgi:hypothetical protein
MLQADFARVSDVKAAVALEGEALALFRRALAINDHDQFPHYRAAILSGRLSDWEAAEKYYGTGRVKPGSVKTTEWEQLRKAIDAKEASLLPT